MAINLTEIDENEDVADAPPVLNQNFERIKEHIDDLEGLLNPDTSVLKLTNLINSVPEGTAEVKGVILTGASGLVFDLKPAGGASVASLNSSGDFSGRKFSATGDPTNKSSFANLSVTNKLETTNADINGVMDLTKTDSVVKSKYTLVPVTDNNVGSTPTTALDVSKMSHVFLDYDNGGVGLASNGEVHLDTQNFSEGQILNFYCVRDNANGMKFWNGTNGNEVFAYLNPAGAGVTSIAAATKPTFAPTSSPNTLAKLTVQWQNIGGGTFRLVVLDYNNVTGVS